EYAVPTHAASSYAMLDRSIDVDGDHRGEAWSRPIYMMYSPDAELSTDFIAGDYVKVYSTIYGTGWTYGHYAKGKDPVLPDGQRPDRREVRSALIRSGWTSTPVECCIGGSDFAEYNTNLQNPEGLDWPLLNKYTESGIYFLTKELLPDTKRGHCF